MQNVARIRDYKRMMRERSKRVTMRGDDMATTMTITMTMTMTMTMTRDDNNNDKGTTMTTTITRISKIGMTGTGMLTANCESHDDLKSMRSKSQSIGMFCAYLYTKSLSRMEHPKVN